MLHFDLEIKLYCQWPSIFLFQKKTNVEHSKTSLYHTHQREEMDLEKADFIILLLILVPLYFQLKLAQV